MPPTPRQVDVALDAFLVALTGAGAVSPRVLKPADDLGQIDALDALDRVTVPPALRAYLTRVGGYDRQRCKALGVYEPEFAWGMHPLDLRLIPRHYDLAGIGGDEHPGYWPMGYLPILWGGSGDYVVVDCDRDSLTYAAVYDLDEAMGASLLAPDLVAFLEDRTRELGEGQRVFEHPEHATLVRPRR